MVKKKKKTQVRLQRHSPEEYVSAYDKARGNPETRVKAVARKLGVSQQAVKAGLKAWWGIPKFQKELPLSTRKRFPLDAEELKALLNRHNGDIRRVAKELKISEQSLRNKLSAWTKEGLIKKVVRYE